MFKNMRLAAKIGLGFFVLIMIAVVLGGLAMYNMNNVKTESMKLADEYVPEVRICNNLERNSLMVMYNMRGYGFTEEPQYFETAQAYMEDLGGYLDEGKTLGEEAVHLKKLGPAIAAIEENAGKYGALMTETEQTVARLNEQRKLLDDSAKQYMQNCYDFLAGQNKRMEEEIAAGAEPAALNERLAKITLVNDIIDTGNTVRLAAWRSQAERSPKVIEDALPEFDKMAQFFGELRKITRLEADIKRIENTEAAASEYKTAMNALLGEWRTLQSLGKQREEAADKVLAGSQDAAKAGIAETENIANTAAGLLGTSTMVMLIGLVVAVVVGIVVAVFLTLQITGPINKVITDLSSGADQVELASSQVADSSQQMAEGASEQASSLEETSASLEEMASMTRQNADNAGQAATMSKDARSAAEKGTEAMTRMNKAIDAIKQSSDETAKIIKTIDEIAFQTNLLALNAAVEAARAGEAGKGFAVVAEEVRNLAQRSADAARSTSELIEGAQQNSDNGVAVCGEVGESLTQIAEVAAKVEQLIDEVSAATQEQSQGIDQVNTAMAEMDKVTQSNAANSEEAASASEELSAQAKELNEAVAVLSMIVGGKNASVGGSRGANGRSAPKALPHHAPPQRPARQQVAQRQAAPAKSKQNQVVDAEEVIPLDDDDMADF